MIFPEDPRSRQKDTGLAILLILLLVTYSLKGEKLLLPAIGILVAVMAFPAIFAPAARVWFALSRLLGKFSSKLILTVIFGAVVTPVALVRRIAGADSMRLGDWKKDRRSLFIERDHTFSSKDLEKPF
ncbi:MAG: SxtJ family membrane protein [Syntrophobacteraceae bacterium]|jgi:hypothetical protein